MRGGYDIGNHNAFGQGREQFQVSRWRPNDERAHAWLHSKFLRDRINGHFDLPLLESAKLIAVGIFEDGHRSPHFGLGLLRERYAFGFQHLGGSEDVITPERYWLKLTDAILLTGRA